MGDVPGAISDVEEVVARLRDSLYAAVGFAVLGVQQAQVQRRALQKELARVAGDVDERLDPVLDDVEARLSDDLRPLMARARSAARDMQRALLGQSGPASGVAGPPPRR